MADGVERKGQRDEVTPPLRSIALPQPTNTGDIRRVSGVIKGLREDLDRVKLKKISKRLSQEASPPFWNFPFSLVCGWRCAPLVSLLLRFLHLSPVPPSLLRSLSLSPPDPKPRPLSCSSLGAAVHPALPTLRSLTPTLQNMSPAALSTFHPHYAS